MSKTVHIHSLSELNNLLASSKIVVTDFYADWCGPCKQIAPHYEQLSLQLSRPQKITFAKVNVDDQQEIARKHNVTAMPTFIIFKKKQVVQTIRGADPRKLSEAVKKLAAEADSDDPAVLGGFGEASGAGAGAGVWLGSDLPKGYRDVTDQVDLRGLDLLNADSSFGDARTLFDGSKPSTLESGKGKSTSKDEGAKKDWVVTDTDEQLMLFVPFQATLKVHTLHITSYPSRPSAEGADDVPMRPKTVRVYSNRAHVLGFEEAEDIPATQEITLAPQDWNEKTGTAKIELRFVKFQNVSSLVVFIVNGEGSADQVRIDRIRIIGETGEKRELGKLEKIDDQSG